MYAWCTTAIPTTTVLLDELSSAEHLREVTGMAACLAVLRRAERGMAFLGSPRHPLDCGIPQRMKRAFIGTISSA